MTGQGHSSLAPDLAHASLPHAIPNVAQGVGDDNKGDQQLLQKTHDGEGGGGREGDKRDPVGHVTCVPSVKCQQPTTLQTRDPDMQRTALTCDVIMTAATPVEP